WVQPDDQRPDEDRSLTFTWEPLETELEILGHPRLQLRIASSVPVAYLSAKVCDVFPDGSSSLVVRGLHRRSRSRVRRRRGRVRDPVPGGNRPFVHPSSRRLRPRYLSARDRAGRGRKRERTTTAPMGANDPARSAVRSGALRKHGTPARWPGPV